MMIKPSVEINIILEIGNEKFYQTLNKKKKTEDLILNLQLSHLLKAILTCV